MEQFADILDTTIINLEGDGNYGELGDGSLYLRLQKKFTEIMLTQCQRWLYQQKMTICRKTEGVDNNAAKISIGGSWNSLSVLGNKQAKWYTHVY